MAAGSATAGWHAAQHMRIESRAERYSTSTRTIERWEIDPTLNFPKAIKIKRRKYWYEDELDEFDAAQGNRRELLASVWDQRTRATRTPSAGRARPFPDGGRSR